MNKKALIPLIIFLVLVLGVAIYGVVSQGSGKTELATTTLNDVIATSTPVAINQTNNLNMKHLITIQTNFGEIAFETYDGDAPKTVDNFIKLAQKGFYNELTFHRVISGFMIQGGDPIGNGTGGPGYEFADELNPNTDSYKQGYVQGVVAMANSGPNTNGSQFFIMLKDTPLQHDYTIFGKVVKGQDVVDAIGNVKTDANDRPLSPIKMEKVTVTSL
jgi:cyclophilin family peptidyl-prolyl cis-trans isomerase